MGSLKLIIGLGNPFRTPFIRHSVGKDFLSYVKKLPGSEQTKGLDLFVPQSFMNLSGRPVKRKIESLQIDLKQILIVHDDLETKFGEVKVKDGGSAQGHNGLKSVKDALGSSDFKRLKIGIGRPLDGESVTDYVLSTFSNEEKEILVTSVFPKALSLIKFLNA